MATSRSQSHRSTPSALPPTSDLPNTTLGILYSVGRGGHQSLVTGYFWLNLAVARGRKEAAERRDFLVHMLDPAALARAQRACASWRPVGH